MKPLGGFFIAVMLLSFTSLLPLARPLLAGFEYGLKKGWVKFPKTFSGTKVR
jgi:hypothetical protein